MRNKAKSVSSKRRTKAASTRNSSTRNSSTRDKSKFETVDIPLILPVELEREEDGRWIADIVDLPGVLCYGWTKKEALSRIREIASKTIIGPLISVLRAHRLNELETKLTELLYQTRGP